MKQFLLTLVLSVALAGQCGWAAETTSGSVTPGEDPVLLQLFYESWRRCRMREDKDGPLTSGQIELACERREALRNVLVDKKYCWDVSEVVWVKCTELPVSEIIEQRATGPKPPEWWHGTFVSEAYKERGCKDSDATVTYSDARVDYWEQSCAVLGIVDLPQVFAVVLEMRCRGGDDIGPDYDTQEILISRAKDPTELAKAGMISYPPGEAMARCEAN